MKCVLLGGAAVAAVLCFLIYVLPSDSNAAKPGFERGDLVEGGRVLGATAHSRYYGDHHRLRKQFRALVQQARSHAGRARVGGSRTLHRAATIKTRWILQTGSFSHTPNGRPLPAAFRKAGFCTGGRSWVVGEVLAEGYPTARAAFDALMASPEHRRVLLGRSWQTIGTSYRDSHELWAISFGRCVR